MIGNKIEPFKIWCQKVLPNVYDDSLSYYEYLCKMNDYLNQVIEQMNTLTESEEQFQATMTDSWNTYKTNLSAEWNEYKTLLTQEWTTYKNYIDNYFDNLSVQTEINHKLDEMAEDGSLDELLLPYFNTYKNEINAIVSTQNSRLTVLEGRMDEFASLPDGSTSGDAELLDIRIGANGVTYSSAGNAVRGQYTELNDKLSELTDAIVIGRKYTEFPTCLGWLGGNDTQWTLDSGYGFSVIPVKKDDIVHLICDSVQASFMLFLSSYKTPVIGETVDFTSTTNLTYRRINEGDTATWAITKRVSVSAGNNVEFAIPNDVNYLLISNLINSVEKEPQLLTINGSENALSLMTQILNASNNNGTEVERNEISVDNTFVHGYLENTKYNTDQFDSTSSPKQYTVEDVSSYVAYNGITQKDNANGIVIEVPTYISAIGYRIYVSENPFYTNAKYIGATVGNNTIKWLKVNRTYWIKAVALMSDNSEVLLKEYNFITKGLRRLNPMSGIDNFRDIGEQVGLNGRKIRQGLLYRSANVSNLTSSDKYVIENIMDVTLVVGLAQDTEDEGVFSDTIETYHPYNLEQWGSLASADTRRKYLTCIRKMMTHLSNGGAVIFHCNGGADRTGLMSAIIEGLCGVDENRICMDYELTSFALNGGANISRTRRGEKTGATTYVNKGFGNGMYNIRNNAWGGTNFTEAWEYAFKSNDLALAPNVDPTFPDGFVPMSNAEIAQLRQLVLE